MNHFFLIDFFSLDKELVKLAEKHAREREIREKREREEREKRDNDKREREAQNPTLKTVTSNHQIQVKPIIETISSIQHTKISRNSYAKMSNGDHDINTTEDLLRFIYLKIKNFK